MTDVTIIPDKWKIKVDKFNYQLIQYDKGGKPMVGKRKGELSSAGWKPLDSYHPTMGQAIRRIINLEASDLHEATLEGYLEMQLGMSYNITKLLKEVV